jgi:hypothetical protein
MVGQFLLLTLGFLALIWLAPLAVAMVPGPTEEDDIPPAIEQEPGSLLPPGFQTDHPIVSPRHLPKLTSIAQYGPEVYAHCLSVGLPNRGALWGGVQFPQDSPYYKTGRGDHQWATPETVDGLFYAARTVHERFGASPKLVLGDISARGGGHLTSHASHQAGRDADVGFFYRGPTPDLFPEGEEKNIDVRRTWAYIEAVVEANLVQCIFLDYALQAVFYDYVKNELHYPAEYLDRVFQYPNGIGHNSGILRHARGHRAHMHLRFHSSIAVANARTNTFDNPEMAELQNLAIERETAVSENRQFAAAPGQPRAASYYGASGRRNVYIVQDGDSLWSIAREHGVTVNQIRAWNGMSSKARLHVGQPLTVYVPKTKPNAGDNES